MSSPTPISASTISSITQPNNNDIIINPIESDNQHPGNSSFQRIINLNKGPFKSAADKAEKFRIAKAIVQSVHESKCRFIERSTGNNSYSGEGWKEVDTREATKFVILSLRGVQPTAANAVPVKTEVIDVSEDNDVVKQEMDALDTTMGVNSNVQHVFTVPEREEVMQQPKISMAQLIKLAADQMTFSKYPVGCRVQYNINSNARAAVTSQAGIKFVSCLRVGKIAAVYMDLGSKGFVYEVLPGGSADISSSSELLTEAQLAYCPGASITVNFPGAEARYDGEIIQCTGSSHPAKMYCVLMFTGDGDAQIFDNVPGDVIRFLHVQQDAANTDGAAAAETIDNLEMAKRDEIETASMNQSNSPLLDKDMSTSSRTIEKPPTATVATVSKKRSASPTISSITQDDNGEKDWSQSESPAKRQKTAEIQLRTSSAPNDQKSSTETRSEHNPTSPRPTDQRRSTEMRSEHNSTSQRGTQPPTTDTPVRVRTELAAPRHANPTLGLQLVNHKPARLAMPPLRPPPRAPVPKIPCPSGGFIVVIPKWLQGSPVIREELFNHLIGNDPNMKKGYKLEALGFQTNCYINIRGPEYVAKKNRGETWPVMHVIIEPKHGIPGNRLPSNPVRAKSSIEDSLREFVGDDGSQGRLAYDLAEVDETSRCRASKTNAVFQWNPFNKSSTRKTIMALVELTFKKVTLSNGIVQKDSHGSFLIKSHNLGYVWNKTKCRITLCGDKYDRPTNLCDDFILVCGDTPANVDRAVDIVNDYIAKHRQTCICSYL